MLFDPDGDDESDEFTIMPVKEGLNFRPEQDDVDLDVGETRDGIDFDAYENAVITGRVQLPASEGGGRMSGVKVSAMDDGEEIDSYTTTDRGTFTLSVPSGTYTIVADKPGYGWKYPDDIQRIRVRDGDRERFGTIQATTQKAGMPTVKRLTDENGVLTGTAEVSWDTDDDDGVTFTIDTKVGATGEWTDAEFAGQTTELGASPDTIRVPADADAGFMVRIVSDAGTPDDGTDDLTSAAGDAGAVNPVASDVLAARGTLASPDNGSNSVEVTWKATTNDNSQQRILVEVALDTRTEWFVMTDLPGSSARDATLDLSNGGLWTTVDGGSFTVTAEHLAKAVKVRLQSRQSDDDDWVDSKNTAPVDEKSS